MLTMMWQKILKKIQKHVGRKKEFPNIPIDSERLKAFFLRATLRILDVGARGGPLKHFQAFAPFAHLFLCEPEKNEADKLEEKMKRKGTWRDVTIIREALGTNHMPSRLFITRQPGLSSLFSVNEEVVSAYYSPSGKGLPEEWEVVDGISVSLMSLDDAVSHYDGMKNLSVIKLDTQGTELDILQSGEKKVLSSVLAVHVEMEEVPLYRDQPLIADVHGFLAHHGFRLIDLKRSMVRKQNSNKPVFSKKEFVYAHALYFRERHEDGTSLTPDEYHKLAAIACGFWFFDYAIGLLEKPEMRAYLANHEFMGIEQDIVNYSIAVAKSISRYKRFNVSGDAYQDKDHEW